MREDLNKLLADLRQMSRQGDSDAAEAVDYIENLVYSGNTIDYSRDIAFLFIWDSQPQGNDFWVQLFLRHREYLRDYCV
jgi:hypothetical protein